jgi:L-ascorbate metabolism protein UlaG (beta-lactamase superfamily)
MLSFLSTSPKSDVENLLKRAGFRLEAKNRKGVVIVSVDHQDHLGDLAADYIVSKERERFVVVVKESAEAFDPTEPAQRRRLGELDRAFALDGLLVVDLPERRIHRLGFKFPKERPLDHIFRILIGGFILGGVAGIIWLLAYLKLL